MTDTDLIVLLIAAVVATWFFGYEVGSLVDRLKGWRNK
jgi:hypothetical protein